MTTLTLHRITAMRDRTTTSPDQTDQSTDERLDRLAQALLPIVFANNSQPHDVCRVSVNNRTPQIDCGA